MTNLVRTLGLWCFLFLLGGATTRTARAEILSLTPDEFHELALTGETLIIDVRVASAFVAGHIENTTYFRNFVSFLRTTPAEDINTTFKAVGLYPCLVHCTTIVYCRSSAAAQATLDLLHDKAGFISARLYNGHGTTNWTDAGYPLVMGPSYRPPCMRGVSEDASGEQFCPTTRNSNTNTDETTNPPVSPPTVQQQKQAPDSKCGSLANEGGRGGSAAAAKDCSRNLPRDRKRIRGL